MADAPPEDWSVWLFNPSLPLAIVATVVYTIATAWISYLTCYRYKAWYFVCVPIGGLCQVTGYAMRAYSTQNHQDIVSSLGPPSHCAPCTPAETRYCGLY